MHELRVCFVGDSFVNGTGDPAYLGWTGRACAAAPSRGTHLTHYNLGVRGETSVEIARRWLGEVTLRIPTAATGRVVFSFGTNDTNSLDGRVWVENAASVAATRQILSAATARYRVLFVGPPPVADRAHSDRIAVLNGLLAKTCGEFDVPYLDVFSPLQQSVAWQQEVAALDGAHPQAAGYAAFAAIFSQWEPWQAWLQGANSG